MVDVMTGTCHKRFDDDVQQQNRKPDGERYDGKPQNKRVIGSFEPSADFVVYEFCVERYDDQRDDPRGDLRFSPDVESVHFRFVTNKMNERDNGKSELQTEDNLTQDKQFSRDFFAEDGNHDNGRNDGDETCDDTAHPRLDSEIEI